jgi:hypothetical protein
VTAEIPQPSDATGVKQVSQTFQLTIENDCPSTVLLDLTISDMTVKVSQSEQQSVEFLNTKSDFYGDPNYCGSRLFVWTDPLPSYLSIDASLATLTLATNDVADVGGPTLIEFTVSLADYPEAGSFTKQFYITIVCEVFELVFSTEPADIFIESFVTPEPVSVPFQTT